jgi:hypothetical protein
LKTQEAITNLGLFFCTHQTAQILLAENSASLEPSQDVILGKRFGSDYVVPEEVTTNTGTRRR